MPDTIIQHILYLAATSEDFRSKLFDSPDTILEKYQLSVEQTQMLLSIDRHAFNEFCAFLITELLPESGSCELFHIFI